MTARRDVRRGSGFTFFNTTTVGRLCEGRILSKINPVWRARVNGSRN